MVRTTLLLVVALAAFGGMPRWANAEPAVGLLALEPRNVGIDLSFSGATVEVTAVVPAGFDAAVRLMGRPKRQQLKKLGKRAGVLWMSSGDITLEHVPSVYQVLTSAPLQGLGSSAARAQWTLGYDALISEQAVDANLRSEFVKLKEHDGLFALREGALIAERPAAVTTAPHLVASDAPGASGPRAASSPTLLRGTFRLPSRVPTGDYAVDLIGFEGERVAHLASATLSLRHVGAAQQLRRLAFDHGLAYGSVASLLAIVVGLLTGFLFRPRAEESH
jgi:hypothetical protein